MISFTKLLNLQKSTPLGVASIFLCFFLVWDDIFDIIPFFKFMDDIFAFLMAILSWGILLISGIFFGQHIQRFFEWTWLFDKNAAEEYKDIFLKRIFMPLGLIFTLFLLWLGTVLINVFGFNAELSYLLEILIPRNIITL